MNTSDEKKISIEELEDLIEGSERKSSFFSFANLFAVLVLNWHWFVLSLVAFVAGAWLYLRYTEPVYRMSARILIKQDNSSKSDASDMLSQLSEFGFLTNSTGITNEMEVIRSRMLMRDAVKDLKLYVEYRTKGQFISPIVYKKQPVSVDLEPTRLDSLDKLLLTGVRSIRMELSRQGKNYVAQGHLMMGDEEGKAFYHQFSSLPSSVKTDYGVLTFTANSGQKWKNAEDAYEITITPPLQVAASYLGNTEVEAMAQGSAVAKVTLKDKDTQRGLDFLSQLVLCYNRQANADKNEIALRTEEFINDRMAKINAELGSTEGALEDFKRRNQMTDPGIDASSSVQMTSQYSAQLSQANSQIQMLDYLREFVNNPNLKSVIPSNVGLTDEASKKLIDNYNQAVQDRNKLLKAVSEEAPQVKTLTSTIQELLPSIQAALLQARKSADIARQGIQSQYAKYQGRVSAAPVQERVLAQIGRQQDVKSSVYLLLLQKREENTIALAATADKGKLLDAPLFEGQVSPRGVIILTLAVLLGLLLPAVILFVRNLFRYKIEGHEDVVRLSQLPIVADVPVASDDVKTAAGIVVRENKNNQIDEIFRGMRTNIQFMLKEQQKVILFTSSAPGEGKTFNAANLAVSFALLGKRVILCGLDIRKPALGRLFGMSDRHEGITHLLTKEQVTQQMLREQIVPSGANKNLDLLLAGPTPPNPTELLARQSFEQVLQLLRADYDYIILDTAPVGIVSDTLQIGRVADITVFIVRADYTPKSSFGLLNTLADEHKMPTPCIVLNGIDMSKRKYGYYYGYGHYGKYGRYGYGKYGYGHGRYGYGNYGNYGSYGRYAQSHYGDKDDHSIKR